MLVYVIKQEKNKIYNQMFCPKHVNGCACIRNNTKNEYTAIKNATISTR